MTSTEPEDVVKIWYDAEGHFLEVEFARRTGYFRETAHEHAMERVDAEGRLIGFLIFGLNALPEGPLDVVLGR